MQTSRLNPQVYDSLRRKPIKSNIEVVEEPLTKSELGSPEPEQVAQIQSPNPSIEEQEEVVLTIPVFDE